MEIQHLRKSHTRAFYKLTQNLRRALPHLPLKALHFFSGPRSCIRVPLVLCTIFFFSIIQFRLALYNYIETNRLSIPRQSKIDRSRDFDLPHASRLYVRHTTPWRKYPDLQEKNVKHPIPPEKSDYRFLVSTDSTYVGENVAERFLVLNFERMVADLLGLTYIDRHHSFGSLTAYDSYAVDNFFGWFSPDFFQRVCKSQRSIRIRKQCSQKLVVCQRLNDPNPFVDRIVGVPKEIALCARSPGLTSCRKSVRSFLRLNPANRTLFHMPLTLCSWKLAWPDQTTTRGWHFSRYWSQPRSSRLDPRFVNIAVHVRRNSRGMLRVRNAGRLIETGFSIADRAYAAVIAQVIHAIRQEEMNALKEVDGTASVRTVFRIKIYSEGMCRPNAWHPLLRFLIRRGAFGRDVNNYDTMYLSDDGIEQDEGYWEDLLNEAANGHEMEDTRVDLHISEDWLEGMEQMIAADVFIGSVASTSVHMVGELSRGIAMLPVRSPRVLYHNKTIEWNPEGGYTSWSPWHGEGDQFFDVSSFREVWHEYRKHIGADVMPLGIPA